MNGLVLIIAGVALLVLHRVFSHPPRCPRCKKSMADDAVTCSGCGWSDPDDWP